MILRDFLNFELGISDANDIPFQNVHRLGARPNGKERSIIAIFTRYNDYERVRKIASENSCTNQHVLSISTIHVKFITDGNRSFQK